MDLVDKFLESIKDEFGNKIDFSNIETEGFSGRICFGYNYAEVEISENQFWIGINVLNVDQKQMLNAFIDYVQTKMKEQREFTRDIKETENSLK